MRFTSNRRGPGAFARWAIAAIPVFLAATVPAHGQGTPAKRLANIVAVAAEEYAKAVDDRGVLISEVEYSETVQALARAKTVAADLSGARAAASRAALDSLAAAVVRKAPSSVVAQLRRTFADALGEAGRLDMPTKALSVEAGRKLYAGRCATCHGDRGMGDGPGSRGMAPPPPALGSAAAMRQASPALMFRVISEGIANTPMIAWAPQLSADDRWNIIAYVTSLHATPELWRAGQSLLRQRCAACVLGDGAADSATAAELVRVIPDIGVLAWQAERSDSVLAATLVALPAADGRTAGAMSPGDSIALVAYARSLVLGDNAIVGGAANSGDDIGAATRDVLAMVEEAIAAGGRGRWSDAQGMAVDAYMAFEPLETRTNAKDPQLVKSIESHFLNLQRQLGGGDTVGAHVSRDAIAAALQKVVDVAHSESTWWSALWQSFLIIMREGFEAILVVGAVVAFLIKTGNRDRLRHIWWGVVAGGVASIATAAVLATALSAVQTSREVLEGVTMLFAVAVLFSVSYWLISKVEAVKWQRFLKEKVSRALDQGGGRALVFVAFLAVYREGAETALFYQVLFNDGPRVVIPIVLGLVTGGAALAVVFTLFYRYGVRIPLRPFFAITGGLLYYLAFAFTGKGLRELQEGQVIAITSVPHVPQIELLGVYPTLETLLGQAVLLALLVFALLKTFAKRRG